MQLCESCEEPLEIQSAVRHNNRVLRRIVRTLRARIETNKTYQDALFIELCGTSPAAELALREIWEKAGLDCSPDDYHTIVEKAVAAFKVTQPGASAHRDPESAD
jgi:8-oxo-dGTP pyrophosphatase MutT (NUDIX family)